VPLVTVDRKRYAPGDMRAMLDKLVDCGLLDNREDEAFRHMRRVLAGNAQAKLSQGQKSWARQVFNRLELDSDECLNLYSAGKVPDGIPMPKTAREIEAIHVLANRPLKPPGVQR